MKKKQHANIHFYKYGFLKKESFFEDVVFKKLKHDILKYLGSIENSKIEINKSNKFSKIRFAKETIINKRYPDRDGDDGMIDVWHINYSLSKKSNESINILKEWCLDTIEKEFKVKYFHVNTNLYVNKSVTNTRGIHSDSNFFPSRIKCFLYLTNIDDIYDGPFSFIKGSHFTNKLDYHKKYDIYEPLNEIDKKNYIIFDKIKENDLLLACVSGAHRGMPQKPNRERIVLVLSFDPTKIKNNYEIN